MTNKRSQAYEDMVAAHRNLHAVVQHCIGTHCGVYERWAAQALANQWWRNLPDATEVRYSDTKTMWWRAAVRRTLPPSWTIAEAVTMTWLFNKSAKNLALAMERHEKALAARESIVL